MRIFVSWTDLTGTKRNTRINVTSCTNTTTLLKLICKQLSFVRQNIVVRVKTQPINLVIVDNWPINHYPIQNGSFLTVQIIQQQGNPNLGQSLEHIQEEQEFLEDGPSSSNDSENKAELVSLQQKYGHYLQQSLNKFLDKVREGNLSDISSILKEEPVVQNEKTLDQLIILKNKYLVNEMGDCGRNALHWAIHMKHTDIVAFLLIKGTNPKAPTLDGYTPLQLAVQHHQPAIVSLLLQQPKLDPNQVTSHGTALHLAVRNGDIKCIQLLLQHEACPEIKDYQGQTPLSICCTLSKPFDLSELSSKPEFICKKCKRPLETDRNSQLSVNICNNCKIKTILEGKTSIGNLIPPSIGKGPVFRVSSTTYRLKQRLLLVNPFKQELIISHLSGEIEDKIKLIDLVRVEHIQEKSWLMKSKLHYWKVIRKNDEKSMLFAVNHSSICKKWLENISSAILYIQHSQYTKSVPSIDQVIQFLDDLKGEVTHHKRKLEQKPKISQSIMNLKPETQFVSPKRTILKQTIQQTESIHSNEDKYRESQIMLGSVIKIDKANTVRSSFQSRGSEEREQYSNRFRKHSESRVEEVSEFETKTKETVTFTDFDIIKQLGTGAFGRVYLAKYRPTGAEAALKVLNKKKLFAKKQLKYAVGETNILKKVDSPFIVKLHCAFQTPNNLYLALDHCPHGDLAELIAIKEHLRQSTAKFIIAQLILAIEYLHKLGILYRDLKPENILIGKDGYIRLTDFGLSRQNSFAGSFCGSPAYLSPQMLQKKGVGVSSDIYGVGCVLYEMVVGEPPYFDQDIDKLFQNIKQGRLRFPSALSQDIRSLLSQLLQRDIKRRLGTKNINDIKHHPFLSKIDWTLLESKRLPIPRQILSRQDEQEEDEIELSTNQHIKLVDHDYSEATRMVNRIKNFTFIREGSLQPEPELPMLQRGTSY